MSETTTPATDPLTLLLRDHGIGAPDILADAIRQDFVMIARSDCPATQFGCRWTAGDGVVEFDTLGPIRDLAEDYIRSLRQVQVDDGRAADAVLVSRPLLPEIPWEVDPGTAEDVSSVSVDAGRSDGASGISAEGAA